MFYKRVSFIVKMQFNLFKNMLKTSSNSPLKMSIISFHFEQYSITKMNRRVKNEYCSCAQKEHASVHTDNMHRQLLSKNKPTIFKMVNNWFHLCLDIGGCKLVSTCNVSRKWTWRKWRVSSNPIEIMTNPLRFKLFITS